MRKLSFFLLILSLALTLTTCSKPSSKEEGTVKAQEEKTVETEEVTEEETANLIFIQTSKAALIKKIGKRGYYLLTLYDVNPYLTYYAERPERSSGIASISDFIDAWTVGDNSFHENHPNALITGALIDGVKNQGSTFYLMTCSTPKYDITKGTLSYVIKPLPKNPFMFDHIKLDYVTVIMD